MDITNQLEQYDYQVVDYFTHLAALPTQANPAGLEPETKERFLACAEYIKGQLADCGLFLEVTEEGYVYGTIPENIDYEVPTIAFMAHYDTALENPGNGTKVLFHKNYQGGDLVLPYNDVVIFENELAEKVGQEVITGSGDNQLGADDKTGVAAILGLARFFTAHPEIPHGNIRLIFTHNEEVGRGTEYLDYEKLNADYVYCVDGGEAGSLFIENFNAEAVDIIIEGVTVHPGYAKDKMVNALMLAHELVGALSVQFAPPEQSEAREPYLGLNKIDGTWTKATVHYLLRAFDNAEIETMRQTIESEVHALREKYPAAQIHMNWDEVHRYRNAAEILDQHPQLNRIAEQAYQAVGVEVKLDRVRGGFDGVRLSFDGLPSTNVFNAAYNMHGLNEWTTREELELVVRMLVWIGHLWSRKQI